MSNIEKMMENISPIINVAGWLLICFSVLMLIFSLKKGLRRQYVMTSTL